MNLTDYAPHMGPNCTTSSEGGIHTGTLYKNVWLVCCWVQQNINGSEHHSTAYARTLHIHTS